MVEESTCDLIERGLTAVEASKDEHFLAINIENENVIFFKEKGRGTFRRLNSEYPLGDPTKRNLHKEKQTEIEKVLKHYTQVNPNEFCNKPIQDIYSKIRPKDAQVGLGELNTPIVFLPKLNQEIQKISDSSGCPVPTATNYEVNQSARIFKPLYCKDDKILKDITRGMQFTISGAWTVPEESLLEINEDVEFFLKRHPFLRRDQIHHSQLFHGSNSSSLLTFTDFVKKRLKTHPDLNGLIPRVQLWQKTGIVPFFGEMDTSEDPSHVNQTSISTTTLFGIEDALKYSKMDNWNKIKSLGNIIRDSVEERKSNSKQPIFKSARVELPRLRHEARVSQYEELSEKEKLLIDQPFPLVYGILARPGKQHLTVHSGIDSEIGLVDGAREDEIRVIFVPRDKIQFVQTLVPSSISVEPILALENNYKRQNTSKIKPKKLEIDSSKKPSKWLQDSNGSWQK